MWSGAPLLVCSSGEVLGGSVSRGQPSFTLWPPLCPLPGFAKKTFIPYAKSFKNSFRQGVVVEIDLKNQAVVLEDGEVSRADSCWWDTWAHLPGRPLAPALPGAENSFLISRGLTTAAPESGGRHLPSLSCTPGTGLGFTRSPVMPAMTWGGGVASCHVGIRGSPRIPQSGSHSQKDTQPGFELR